MIVLLLLLSSLHESRAFLPVHTLGPSLVAPNRKQARPPLFLSENDSSDSSLTGKGNMENLFLFQSPGETKHYFAVQGQGAKEDLQRRGWKQLEVSLASSAEEVAALLDNPIADPEALDAELQVAMETLYDTDEERYEAIKTPIEKGASITRTFAMMRAASDPRDGERLLKILVKLGGNVADRDKYGSTALHIAAAFCNAKAVEFLLEQGADLEALDNDGLTPKDAFANTVERNQGMEMEFGIAMPVEDRERQDRIQELFNTGSFRG